MGLKMSSKLAEKQHALHKLSEILINLKNQICCLGTPLFAAFEHIGEASSSGIWSDVFKETGSIMRQQHVDSGSAWKQAIEKHREQLPFDDSEICELYDFGELFGKSDRMNQDVVIGMERERITMLEKRAQEEVVTKGKLYRNLGALTGAAMVILLI